MFILYESRIQQLFYYSFKILRNQDLPLVLLILRCCGQSSVPIVALDLLRDPRCLCGDGKKGGSADN